MAIDAPLVSRVHAVEEDWIDYNGHMNMGYYSVLFDRCADDAFELMGMGPAYVKERRLTVYTAEFHICYIRELHLGHKVAGTLQLVDHDEKRLRFYQELHHADGWLAATAETLTLHVDMEGPRVAPFPPDVREKIEAIAAAHAGLPMPERAGRSIAIKRKR